MNQTEALQELGEKIRQEKESTVKYVLLHELPRSTRKKKS